MNQSRRNELSTHVTMELPGATGKEQTANTHATLQQLVQSFHDELASKAKSLADRKGSGTLTDADLLEAYRAMPIAPTPPNKTRKAVAQSLTIAGSLIAANIPATWWGLTGLLVIAAGQYIEWSSDH